MSKKYVIREKDYEGRYLTHYAINCSTSLDKAAAEIFYSKKEAKRIAEACLGDDYEIEYVR